MLEPEHDPRCAIYPGPVANEETVIRILYSPELYDLGVPTPAAFRKEELNDWARDVCGDSSGISLQRTPPCSPDQVAKITDELVAAKPERSGAPPLYANVADIRKIPQESGEQALVLLADGRVGDEGHCVMRSIEKLSKGGSRRLRGMLLEAFSSRLTAPMGPLP